MRRLISFQKAFKQVEELQYLRENLA